MCASHLRGSNRITRILRRPVAAMMQTGCDPLQIQRMKKKKLAIKDQLQRLEDQLIPDIIA